MNKNSLAKNARLVVLALLVVQIAYIVFLNIAKCHDWIDHDASMLYSHTIRMWEQKKFILPFFQEDTYYNIDTSCILAMPLYGLFHDIFLAYGVANIIFLALTLFVMLDLLKKLGVKDIYKYAALLVYLIPYRIWLCEYINMLYFACSFYNICVLLTLLGIDLFLATKEDEKTKKYYVLMVLYAFFLALSALSRGTFILLIGILPIIGCYVLEVILSEEGFSHIRRSKIILLAVTVLSFGAGLALQKMMGLSPNVESYSLVLPRDIFNNFVHVFWGHLSIFMDPVRADVFSEKGIRWLILFAFAILMLIVFVFNLRHAFSDEEHSNSLRYLTLVYAWAVILLGLINCSDSEFAFPERYLFPGFIPLVMSTPIMLTYMERIKRNLLRGTMYTAVCTLTFLTLLVSDKGIMDSMNVNEQDTQGIREVLAYAKENDIHSVYFLNDENAGLIARSLDPTLHVVPIEILEDGSYGFRARETYICAQDRAYYDDDNLLAVTWNEQPENFFPEYMLSSYQGVGDVEDYHLYRAGSNKFDVRAGFPLNDNVLDESIDFCHTNGYQTAGTIDAYGYLETTGNGDYVLLSPLLDAPYAPCDVTLYYENGYKTGEAPASAVEGDHKIGEFRLLDENLTPVDAADISSGADSAQLSVNPGSPCYLAVLLDAGESVTISEIHYKIK